MRVCGRSGSSSISLARRSGRHEQPADLGERQKRRDVRVARRRHARIRREPLDHALDDGELPFARRRRRREHQLERHDVAGSKPGSTVCSLTKLWTSSPAPTSSIVARLTCDSDEQAAEPLRRPAARRPTRDPPAAIARRGVRARQVQRRRQPERRARRSRNAERRDKRRAVDAELRHARQQAAAAEIDRELEEPRRVDRRQALDQPHRAERDGDAADAAGQREHDALGEQLADDAPTAGADRQPHADLALARGAAREQQVGDVGARDQQDDEHRGGEHAHLRPDRIDDQVLDAEDLEPRPVGEIQLAAQLSAERRRRGRRRRRAERRSPTGWRRPRSAAPIALASSVAASRETPSLSRAIALPNALVPGPGRGASARPEHRGALPDSRSPAA